MEFKRIFTREEAQSALPLVRQIVADILETAVRIRDTDANDEDALSALRDQLQENVDELESMGCFYKDWDFSAGLVDFPAIVDGEVVFLCWRSDEHEVSWYHPVEEGYRGRRRLSKAPQIK